MCLCSLDQLPAVYTPAIDEIKCEAVAQDVYDGYGDERPA